MNDVVNLDRLAKLKSTQNLAFSVNISQPKGSDVFLAFAEGSLFNPEVFVNNGGPVTVKSVKTLVEGSTFQEAKNNALVDLSELLGL